MMTLDEAIRFLRVTPKYEDLVRDAYLGRDVAASAERFYRSIEFAELLHLLGSAVHNATVVDLGAGTGIASYAFLKSDARHVYAIEPDPSDEVGRGAIQRLSRDPTLEIIDAFADKLPLPDDSIDIFYCRQVLHHIPDLNAAMREATRVLKPGGTFIACREHVVETDEQMRIFLDNHAVHQLAGGENAYSLSLYLSSIRSAKLTVKRTIAPLDSVINAFPSARTNEDLNILQSNMLKKQFGTLGFIAAKMPITKRWLLQHPEPIPGRLYSFVAVKPT